MKKNETFVNKHQELMWNAFSGKCGEEFTGNPALMENFIEYEELKNIKKEDFGREM